VGNETARTSPKITKRVIIIESFAKRRRLNPSETIIIT